jgi:hypothetical protein
MSAIAAKKFRTLFKVRPSVDHPSFYEFQWGILAVILIAGHDFEAEERSKAIVAQLPFEVVGECGGAVLWTEPRKEHEAYSEEMLMTLGFAYYIIRVPLEEFDQKQPEDIPWGVQKEGPDCL